MVNNIGINQFKKLCKCNHINYNDYNFKQIDNKNTPPQIRFILTFGVYFTLLVCVFFTYQLGKPRLWFLHFLYLLYKVFIFLSINFYLFEIPMASVATTPPLVISILFKNFSCNNLINASFLSSVWVHSSNIEV